MLVFSPLVKVKAFSSILFLQLIFPSLNSEAPRVWILQKAKLGVTKGKGNDVKLTHRASPTILLSQCPWIFRSLVWTFGKDFVERQICYPSDWFLGWWQSWIFHFIFLLDYLEPVLDTDDSFWGCGGCSWGIRAGQRIWLISDFFRMLLISHFCNRFESTGSALKKRIILSW